MSSFNDTGGLHSVERFDFFDLVYSHLLRIFPAAECEALLPGNAQPNLSIDLSVRSENQRLLLFEVKYIGQGKRLPNSIYLSIAAMKDAVDRLLSNEAPVLTLITNVDVDQKTEKTFSKSGIPVIKLGVNPEQTKARLSDAFKRLAISVPELDSGVNFSSYTIHRNCFVSTSFSQDQQYVYEHAIKPAALSAGYNLTTAADIEHASLITEAIHREIQQADVIIADITDASPYVFYELGIATGLGKNLILITQNAQSPVYLPNVKHFLYRNTLGGLNNLQNVLIEQLVALQNRLQP